MSKIVYVPQGRGASLTRFSQISCPQTLYTDKVSICSIVAGFTKNQNTLILMHLDSNDLSHLKSDSFWLKFLNTYSENCAQTKRKFCVSS